MSKYKKVEDCSSGREFGIYAQAHEDEGVRISKNGSYLCVETKEGRAYVPDSDRALPKPSRELIINAFRLIGLAALVLTILYLNSAW